jgi:choline dehydrogenase
VLANRLSADPGCRVLLVEAGPPDHNPLLRVPVLAGRWFTGHYLNWAYLTEPQPHLNQRPIPWPRGRVLGGSSSINGMIYARGNPQDFARWTASGLRDWSMAQVLPYFRRAERFLDGGDDWRGGAGPLPVGRPRVPAGGEIYSAFIAASQQAGFRYCENFNGRDPEGVGYYDYNIVRGSRWSAARAYLDPARCRANLSILTHARVLRLMLERGVTAGVEVLVGGARQQLRAEREVILACGAVASPAVLLHSGIGDARALSALGIEVRADRPSVGANLQDHCHAMVTHSTPVPDGVYDLRRIDRAVFSVLRNLALGTGLATVFPTLAGAFLRSDPQLTDPDIQLHFILGAGERNLRHPFSRHQGYQGNGFNGSFCQLRPESRGRVFLKSGDPLQAPGIDPNYLATDSDRRSARAGFKMVREIFRQNAFDAVRGAELAPGPAVQSDIDIDRWIAGNAGTIYHPAGSCRMGSDPDSVVDEQLRVRGVERLRVIDASVMPLLVSANTHAATVMIAERGAEFLLRGRA